ncbi:hypothetical protein Bca52824_003878 [Brassica carinata]|uniref:Uncharacterized protein n=1 Tax=Brassica carinata TaxID=52824 RepID=A0A8X7WR03_BRACI|nr:hypothetical protein Bca52824_003878 [Brassica carinata]
MNAGDGEASDGTASRSSLTVLSYTILSLDQSKTSPPKRRRARSTQTSHQHHTFWNKKRHRHKRKRKKISSTEKRKQQEEIKSTSQVFSWRYWPELSPTESTWKDKQAFIRTLRTRFMLNGGVLMRVNRLITKVNQYHGLQRQVY